jgi:hypothetical protein
MFLQKPLISDHVFALQGGIFVGLKHYWVPMKNDNIRLEHACFHNQQIWANHPIFAL